MEYRVIFERLARVTGKSIEVIHTFGGGSLNQLLNQMTANATGRPVVAGPVEATVLGNVLVQLIACGELNGLQEARQIVAQSGQLKRFEPQETSLWEEATQRYKDNRILPRGFRVADASARLCEPVSHGVSDTNYHSGSNYYTQPEYEGGYDDVTVELPAGTERIEAGLYYQTTSREFIEFLRNEINGTNGTLPNVAGAGGDLPYLAQTDPFFSGMAAWGDTI